MPSPVEGIFVVAALIEGLQSRFANVIGPRHQPPFFVRHARF